MQYGELEEAIGFAFRSCLDTPDPWRREPLENDDTCLFVLNEMIE